jgi:hypothetical protein
LLIKPEAGGDNKRDFGMVGPASALTSEGIELPFGALN